MGINKSPPEGQREFIYFYSISGGGGHWRVSGTEEEEAAFSDIPNLSCATKVGLRIHGRKEDCITYLEVNKSTQNVLGMGEEKHGRLP